MTVHNSVVTDRESVESKVAEGSGAVSSRARLRAGVFQGEDQPDPSALHVPAGHRLQAAGRRPGKHGS